MIKAVQKAVPTFEVGGFIDNDQNKHGCDFFGYPVLGGFEVLREIVNDNVRFVNLITRNAILRYQTTKRLVTSGAVLANFIHPSIDLTMVDLGFGNYIQEGVILQAGVKIGDNCSIHMGALIGHETAIGSDTFIAHGVSVSGCCEIGQGCFLGTNSTIYPRVKIGNWSTVAAGSVIRKNIAEYSIIAGNPSRKIKSISSNLVDEEA